MTIRRRCFLEAGLAGAATLAGCAAGLGRRAGAWPGPPPGAALRVEAVPGGALGPDDEAALRRRLFGLPQSHLDFPLGVMAGDVTPDAAMLWTRYTGRGALWLLVQQADPAGRRTVFAGEVRPGADGFVHVDVRGLRAGARHGYAFVVREGSRLVLRGPSGRFRTALAPDALEPVTFAGTSCTNQWVRPFPAMAHAAARRDLSFFIHGGDHAYCDGARSLAAYRRAYAAAWPAYGLRALHAATALYTTWDDHDVANNWNPETHNPVVVANARRAFFEHRPVRRDPAHPDRIWRSFTWGRTAEVFVLDSRGERRPSTRTGPRAEYLSHTQLDWLKQGLLRSRAVFKFIVNSVPIGNFPGIFDIATADRWEGYPAQRAEILEFVAARGLRGVWWLSGDFHVGTVNRVEPAGPFATAREVLMGPGGNLPNPVASALRGPQFDFVTGQSNFTLFRADPRTGVVEVAFVNTRGETLFARRYEYA